MWIDRSPYHARVNDALPWLTLALSFLGAIGGGAVSQWFSDKRQSDRARKDRRRDVLVELQGSLRGHLSDTGNDWWARRETVGQPGERASVTASTAIGDRQPYTYADHLLPRLQDDELNRLVAEFLNAASRAALFASSTDDADRAMVLAIALNMEASRRVAELLAEVP